jgi:hypothetical protein
LQRSSAGRITAETRRSDEMNRGLLMLHDPVQTRIGTIAMLGVSVDAPAL